ncbi:hypothetical protein RBB50_003378 [Rhinocladiella similis]
MRLLTWDSQNEFVLTDDRDENIPPYAILSHTWGPERDEVTFADIQNRRGQSKAGYDKIRFCANQARKDKIEYFWIDTCCINKAMPNELLEAIIRMFRWYQDATKCYVYLSDVSGRKYGNITNLQSTWGPNLRISLWFTRGWTLQELLAPRVVEFFSQEGDFLGTKETLAQLIHEVTTLPLAALRGEPLSQFSIDERIRWTEKRQTKKREDGAYCLLGIFEVYMPLLYGEGDNAFSRLREEINKKCGGNVAARLGAIGEVGSMGLYERPAPLNVVDDFIGRASDLDQMAQETHLGEQRPAKRARISYNTNTFSSRASLSHGNITASHMGIMDGHIQHSGQDPRDDPMVISEDKYKVLLNSLIFNRIDFRVNNVKRELLSTCQWLFRHPHFQTWNDTGYSAQHSGFLWIKGKPGCGKSTLMKALFEWARKQKSKDRVRQTIVPYFFNARASASLEKSSLGLYRTVVHRLLSSYPNLRALFAEKFSFKEPGQLGENWTVEELQGFLFDSIESNESFGLCLLIDALDEAEYENDVREMISFLVHLSDRALQNGSSCKLRICLSSRHFPHITITKGLSIVVEDQREHDDDIDYYITKELTYDDGPEKSELRAEILNKSDHIFLWVVLVVQILNRIDDPTATLEDVKNRLKAIPAGIKELFQEILMKSDVGIETSVLFFQWMVFCKRPLEPAELFVAVEYSKSPDENLPTFPTEISVPAHDRLTRFIVNCSRGLVEVVEVGPSQAATVQFIHETVREFLLKENGLSSICPALAMNTAGISHEILRVACFRRMSMTAVPKEYEHYSKAGHKTNTSLDIFKSSMRLKLPFLDYAISYLLDHAEQAQKYGISQQAFLKSQIDAMGLWMDPHKLWWNILERYKSKKVKSNTTLIYILAEQQYSNLLAVVPSTSNAINVSCGAHGSALNVSSYHGSQEIVQMLLDKGADVNAKGVYGSALYVASRHGHEKVVQTLVDGGVDINAEGKYGSALYVASKRGHEKVVQTLVDGGVDINAEGEYGSALYVASKRGHEKVVQTLVDGGVDINAEGEYGSALYVALVHGYEKIVQILLDRGANVNAQGGYFGNALQAASINGHEKTVRLLLNAGADVNAQGGYFGNALQATSGCGHEKTVRLLLNAGANVNAQGGFYGNAIQAASGCGHEKIVQILLNAAADVNAQG